MRLTMGERKTVTKALCERYRRAAKGKKGRMLDEFVQATGYNRCYARRVLRNHGRRVEVAPGVVVQGDRRLRPAPRRKRRYGPDVATALKTLWTYADYLCGKRLKPALPGLIEQLEAFKEIRLNKPLRAKLLSISASSIDRLLEPEREKHTLKHRGLTKPGTLLKHQIPIRTFSDWDDARPGFLEIDLVGHEGGLAKGDFCVTLDVTDVSSGWTELAAAQNKAQIHVFAALKAIRARLPFAVLGIDSDNGSEFINSELTRYCRAERIAFTRSRPYRKNDTCYVEQKTGPSCAATPATHATSPPVPARSSTNCTTPCATTRTFFCPPSNCARKSATAQKSPAATTRRKRPINACSSPPTSTAPSNENSRNATTRSTPPHSTGASWHSSAN